MEMMKILVAVDYKPQSIAALDFAGKLAKIINAKVTCLYIIEEYGYITSKYISEEQIKKIRYDAEISLARLINGRFQNDNVPFEIIISKGKVYEKIAETAKMVNADFIIMGRSDSTDFKKNITGTNNSKHETSELGQNISAPLGQGASNKGPK